MVQYTIYPDSTVCRGGKKKIFHTEYALLKKYLSCVTTSTATVWMYSNKKCEEQK